MQLSRNCIFFDRIGGFWNKNLFLRYHQFDDSLWYPLILLLLLLLMPAIIFSTVSTRRRINKQLLYDHSDSDLLYFLCVVSDLIKPPGGITPFFFLPQALQTQHEVFRGYRKPCIDESPQDSSVGCLFLSLPRRDIRRTRFQLQTTNL